MTGKNGGASRWQSRSGGLVLLTALAVALPAAATAGSSTPRVIPWLDAQPQRAPAHPPLAPPCRVSALRAALFLEGATGSLVGGVTLANSGRPCALLGWPRVSFAGAAAQVTRWRAVRVAGDAAPPDPLADPPGSLRALAHDKSARVALVWSNWCGPGSSAAGSSGERPVALVLALASGTTVRLPLTGARAATRRPRRRRSQSSRSGPSCRSCHRARVCRYASPSSGRGRSRLVLASERCARVAAPSCATASQ